MRIDGNREIFLDDGDDDFADLGDILWTLFPNARTEAELDYELECMTDDYF